MKLKTLIAVFCAMVFILCSCGSNTDVNIPDGMKAFSGEDVDYTVYVPESWNVDMSTGVSSAYVSSVDASNVTITAQSLNAENLKLSLDEYFETYKGEFDSTFADMKMLDEGKKITLGGVEARQYVFTATVTDMDYKFMQIICKNNSNVYIFTYTSTPENYDKNLDDVNNIINSFSFD